MLICLCWIVLISCTPNEREEIISGENGNYWDIIYSHGKDWRHGPIQGYFIRPDGQYYAYHYYGVGRTPFNERLSDTSSPPTIKDNLFNWELLNDSTLKMEERLYTIKQLKNDTLILKTNLLKNPLIKLVRINSNRLN